MKFAWLVDLVCNHCTLREINTVDGLPYLKRWYVIPRNRFFNIYLHKFVSSDDDRALHDHPWFSLSYCLEGYAEELIKDKPSKDIKPGAWFFRSPWHAHRIVLDAGGPVWTVFITGPVMRQWGFHCPSGWVHWKKFEDDKGCA